MLDLKDLRGVIPPIVTPVDSKNNVDAGGIKRVIDHVMNGGVHGIFVLGSSGEFYGLDHENQLRALQITVDHIGGKVPVYAGTGAISTKECCTFSNIAEINGADAITVLTPMYINPSEAELYQHFKSIAEQSPLPVIIYNNPGKTNNNISVTLLKRLAEIENIVGIKNTNLNFAQTIQFIHATKEQMDFNVLAGTDYFIYATLLHGGTGCIAGTANVAPSLVVDIYNKFIEGDHAGALEAQFRLLPLRDAYGYGSFPVVMKDCLNLMGLNVGDPIKPIDHCSSERMNDLKKILTDLDLIN
jgi:4-hydroxy-tetrahydrodipicolinate synthase